MIDQGNATVMAAIIAGGVSVAVSAVITPFVNSWLEKKRFERERKIEEAKLFSDEQKERAVTVLNDVRAFYTLEELYTEEIARLRTGSGEKVYNKKNSVKVEFREKLPGDMSISYMPSKYNDLLNYLSKTRPAVNEVVEKSKQTAEENKCVELNKTNTNTKQEENQK